MPNPIPNPTGCCDVSACCLGHPTARSLVATITSVQNCGCADGATVPLVWGGNYNIDGSTSWNSATVDFGSCLNATPPPTNEPISLSLLCSAGATFKLDWSLPDCSAGGEKLQPDSCSGCPGCSNPNGAFSLVYDNLPVGGCCHNIPMPLPKIRITITDG